MESTEPREPSYYEVALTHRQVLVAFVVLLTCLLAAFLSGVWVGRGAEPATRVAAAPPPSAAPDSPPIEQLTFFAGKEPGARGPAKSTETEAPKPAPPAAKPAEDPATEAMRRTLEAEMEAHREPAPESDAPATAPGLAAGERTRPASAAAPVPAAPAAGTQVPKPAVPAAATPAPKPAAPAATAAGSIWIQVYSSTNGPRAQEIAGKLRKARFPVVVAELQREGQSAWRVRVGPYPTRAKADAAATRLRREQKLDTWVTDTP